MKEFATRFVPDMAEQCEVRLFISGHQGGDAGHGADATIEFVPQSGACMLEVEFEKGEVKYFGYNLGDQIKKVSFSMLGDWEMEGLAFALIELGQSLLSREDIRKDYVEYKTRG